MRNKSAIVFVFAVLCLSCKSTPSNRHYSDDYKRKQTFIKIISFLKINQIDSVKSYVLNHVDNDSGYFDRQMSTANKIIMDSSPRFITADSIKITDSSFITNSWLYNYSINFFDSGSKKVGSITLSFYNNTDKAINLFTRREVKMTEIKIPD